MAREYQLIDSVAYPPSMKIPKDPLLSKVFGDTKFEGETIEQMVARMDECAIQASTIHNCQRRLTKPFDHGQKIDDAALDAACKDVADMMARYPGRFFGCVAVDPTGMMKAVRRLERAVREYGFNVCFVFAGCDRSAAQSRVLFPDLRKVRGIGHPGQDECWAPRLSRAPVGCSTHASGRGPAGVPELTVVGAHVGHPWHALECVRAAAKISELLPAHFRMGAEMCSPGIGGNSPIGGALINLCGRVDLRCCPWSALPGRAGKCRSRRRSSAGTSAIMPWCSSLPG